jgi:hypothetical protein
MDEFLNEVALITGIKHRNLVKLKGCCIRKKQRLLVYEYVDNHDLDWNLLGKFPSTFMAIKYFKALYNYYCQELGSLEMPIIITFKLIISYAC